MERWVKGTRRADKKTVFINMERAVEIAPISITGNAGMGTLIVFGPISMTGSGNVEYSHEEVNEPPEYWIGKVVH